MRILVTTSNGLLLVDGRNVRVISETKEPHNYYGITWDEKYLYAVRYQPNRNILERWTKDFKFVDGRDLDGVMDSHQLHYHEGVIYVANTRFNRISTYNVENGKQDWFTWRRVGRDINHINSIWTDDRGVFYFCEHNRYLAPVKRSRIRFMGKRLINDMRSGRQGEYKTDNYQVGRGLHNVYREGDFIYTCSSIDNTLMKYDTRTREVVKEIDFTEHHPMHYERWHTRGLGYDGNKWYVGLSEYGKRPDRHNAMLGGIAVCSERKEDFNPDQIIEIPGKGQIFEVRLLDGLDKCHNGIRW